MAKEMQSLVICNNCQRICSNLLSPVEKVSESDSVDCQNIVAKGHFWIARDFIPEHVNGNVVINLNDFIGLKPHPDKRRHNGCCDDDGCDGPNLICACGEDLATRVADCWTGYYGHYDTSKVHLETPNV